MFMINTNFDNCSPFKHSNTPNTLNTPNGGAGSTGSVGGGGYL